MENAFAQSQSPKSYSSRTRATQRIGEKQEDRWRDL